MKHLILIAMRDKAALLQLYLPSIDLECEPDCLDQIPGITGAVPISGCTRK